MTPVPFPHDCAARFTAEARVASILNHPNIVTLLDHGIGKGVPWIAYQLVKGVSLRRRLEEGPLDWREACAAAMQIASAREEAHGKAVLDFLGGEVEPCARRPPGRSADRLGMFRHPSYAQGRTPRPGGQTP